MVEHRPSGRTQDGVQGEFGQDGSYLAIAAPQEQAQVGTGRELGMLPGGVVEFRQ